MNAGEWFWRGDQFLAAGQVLSDFGNQTGNDLPLPQVTCLAFSAECYLKCLLRVRGKNAMEGEHHLLELFKPLPQEDRQSIQEQWDPVMLPELERTARDSPRHLAMITVPRTMKQMLKLNGNAFKEWRYRIKNQGVWIMGPFPQCVRQRILDLRPQWGTSPPDPSYGPDSEL